MWNRTEEAYDRMYYSYADESFTKLTKPRLLFDWGYATIDADINLVPADGLYHMLIKKEGGTPGIYTSLAEKLTGPWSEPLDGDYVSFEGEKKCEGASAFQLIGENDWRVAYVEYTSKPPGATRGAQASRISAWSFTRAASFSSLQFHRASGRRRRTPVLEQGASTSTL
jgi:hypothetical protein